MDFEFSQDEQLFRETVRDFAQKEIRPYVREMDEKGEMPKGLVKKMADLGLLGITIPEKYGGPGGNFITAKHTRHFMRREHYQPSISDRNHREEWESRGSKTTWERAANKVKELLDADKYSLPDAIRTKVLTEIEGIVD